MKTKPSSLALVIAFLTCPCHLLILLPLLAGTAIGAWLNIYFMPVFIAFSILFVVSIIKILKTQ
jgi:mercuric ion transport protein